MAVFLLHAFSPMQVSIAIRMAYSNSAHQQRQISEGSSCHMQRQSSSFSSGSSPSRQPTIVFLTRPNGLFSGFSIAVRAVFSIVVSHACILPPPAIVPHAFQVHFR
ncbi:hypothetical protein O6H91_20G017400 [Diphasiastrum complanatum]|uniref:Uncharacterized protein n=1 Tax=Diphasiastrum complanatum TaxID=34168 RepID=A0ACC2ANM1_DIPCM|nr:hypothetical protein O6H91_20G017400 [Diphasiastrum complanatum]